MRRWLNIVFPFVDFLYIFQLEEYAAGPYLDWIKTRWWKRNFQKVGNIVWTTKAVILLILSFLIFILALASIFGFFNPFLVKLIGVAIALLIIPLLILVAAGLFWPIDFLAKQVLVQWAKKKLAKFSNCRVIAIAGSYGKSTTRFFLYHLIQTHVKAHTPEGNVNTLVGLAWDILKYVTRDTRVYLVELGEYYPGDLRRFRRLLHPEIIVLTAIGPQHIASFGSQEAVDKEFLTFLRKTQGAPQYASGDDPGIQRVLKWYQSPQLVFYRATDVDKFEVPAAFVIPHLKQNLAGALQVARHVGVPEAVLREKLSTLRPLERRLSMQEVNGVLVIDDSYNINPRSAEAALRYLATFRNRRKILVTGGIVDQGEQSVSVNEAYGQQIAATADVVVIAENVFARFLKQGLARAKRKIEVWLSPHPKKTPEILQSLIRNGDVVLVQNELPDLYWH